MTWTLTANKTNRISYLVRAMGRWKTPQNDFANPWIICFINMSSWCPWPFNEILIFYICFHLWFPWGFIWRNRLKSLHPDLKQLKTNWMIIFDLNTVSLPFVQRGREAVGTFFAREARSTNLRYLSTFPLMFGLKFRYSNQVQDSTFNICSKSHWSCRDVKVSFC